MTNQFKFGDRVYHPEYHEGVVVYFGKDKYGVLIGVYHENGACNEYSAADLKPVPHPDTIRLDWLAAQDDIDITLGNAISFKIPDLRTATDTAMRRRRRG